MMNRITLSLLFAINVVVCGFAQNADPSISMIIAPSSIPQNQSSILTVTTGNSGSNTILTNTLRIVISAGTNAEIIGLASGSDPRWTVSSLAPGAGNTIVLRNTVGGFGPSDLGTVNITVKGVVVNGPDLILGNIVYVTGLNPALGSPPPAPNAIQGNTNTSNDNAQTPLTVTPPVEICGNGLDDESDGFTDCDDADCNISGTNGSNTVSITPATVAFCIGGSQVLVADITNVSATPPAVTYSWSGGAAPLNQPTVTVSTAATYTVTVTRATGCSATDSRVVTVNPLPVATITASPNPVCRNTTLNLSVANAGVGASYSWTGNGIVAANAASTTAVPSVAGAQAYTVTVTTAAGCSASSSTNVTVNNCNTPPIADDETVATTMNVSVNIPVLVGDIDNDLPVQTLTVTQINGINAVVGTPITVPNGTATLQSDGTVTFVPTTGITGISTFPYTICDNGAPILCDQGQVTVSVLPDYDGDGIADANDIDDDNDGILDTGENSIGLTDGGGDTDGDFVQNYQDTNNPSCGGLNANGACINYDFDGDGVPNQFDLDSDNDGLTDVLESGGSDADNNGIVGVGASASITDTDNDGLAEIADATPLTGAAGSNGTTAVNSDVDTRPNFLDIDSDNDGIVDNIEWQTSTGYIAPTNSDSDGDGLDNAYDQEAGLGDMGNTNTPTNTDGTDTPDYIDTNSDNDVQNDAIEGWDTNGDNVANTVPSGSDTDNDGLDNAYDVNDAAVNPTNSTTPSSYPNLDASSTPQLDWREVTPEICNDATNLDEDGDGLANCADINSCPAAPTTLVYPDNIECTNGVDLTPTFTPTGGTFSATPAGLAINTTTGVIDVSISIPGTYSVTYTSPATATNCPGSANATVKIVVLSDDPNVVTKL